MTKNDIDQINRFPFDWQNPFGFLVAIALQYALTTYTFMIASPIIAMAIASHLYAIALSKVIKGSIFFINRSAQAKKTDQSICLEQIVEFLELHSSAKQLSRKSIKCSFVCPRALTLFLLFFQID